MNLIDCHTHTHFSIDSEAVPEEMIDSACKLGLSAIAVTDHCECNCFFPKEHYGDKAEISDYFNYKSLFEDSVDYTTKLKEKYSDKIQIICGTELGQAVRDFRLAEEIVSDKRLDFVIASIHQLADMDDFAFINWTSQSDEEISAILEKYFLDIHKLSKWGKFDILGHLTYTLRYIQGKYKRNVDISQFDDIIDESFRALIQNGCGIEINTSGLRQDYGDTFPTIRYIKRYRELGGEILSVGSDAHIPQDVGAGIEKGAYIALEAGFKYLCCFTERKPQFININ